MFFFRRKSYKHGDFVIITNKKHTFLCSGCIIDGKKAPIKCISTDYKHYFNINSKNIRIEVVPEARTVAPINLKQVVTAHWKEVPFKLGDVDVYVDQSIDEVDADVAPLVNVLNTIKGVKTTSSCCGHNMRPMYVDLFINNMITLREIIFALRESCFEFGLENEWWFERGIAQSNCVGFRLISKHSSLKNIQKRVMLTVKALKKAKKRVDVLLQKPILG